MTYRSDGILRAEELERLTPSAERLAEGPLVVIECVENIPCNPCVTACPKGAITIEGDMNSTPVVDVAICDGCGVCISACPGLAIFSIDAGGDGDTAKVSLPYEFLPLPEPGDVVTALDRNGEVACEAKVTKVLSAKALDRTPVITLEVPRGLAMEVRHFRRGSAK